MISLPVRPVCAPSRAQIILKGIPQSTQKTHDPAGEELVESDISVRDCRHEWRFNKGIQIPFQWLRRLAGGGVFIGQGTSSRLQGGPPGTSHATDPTEHRRQIVKSGSYSPNGILPGGDRGDHAQSLGRLDGPL